MILFIFVENNKYSRREEVPKRGIFTHFSRMVVFTIAAAFIYSYRISLFYPTYRLRSRSEPVR